MELYRSNNLTFALVHVELTKAAEQLGWDNLQNSGWSQLKRTWVLLKQFAQNTSLIGGNEYATVSAECLIAVKLLKHLEKMKKQQTTPGMI